MCLHIRGLNEKSISGAGVGDQNATTLSTTPHKDWHATKTVYEKACRQHSVAVSASTVGWCPLTGHAQNNHNPWPQHHRANDLSFTPGRNVREIQEHQRVSGVATAPLRYKQVAPARWCGAESLTPGLEMREQTRRTNRIGMSDFAVGVHWGPPAVHGTPPI